MLAKEPHRRYPDTLALADDLDRFLEGRPVVARPISAIEHLGRRCRRNPCVAILVAAVLVLLFTVVTIRSTAFAIHPRGAHGTATAAAVHAVECASRVSLTHTYVKGASHVLTTLVQQPHPAIPISSGPSTSKEDISAGDGLP